MAAFATTVPVLSLRVETVGLRLALGPHGQIIQTAGGREDRDVERIGRRAAGNAAVSRNRVVTFHVPRAVSLRLAAAGVYYAARRQRIELIGLRAGGAK